MRKPSPLPWNAGRRKVYLACRAMMDVIAGCTDRELEAVIHRLGTLRQTNCSWVAYGARGVLSKVAKNEQLLRRQRKAGKAGSAA
jgi:hypothetical protein